MGGEKIVFTPLVSIVFLSYNQVDYVEDSLKSLFFQDYNNIEIIVSDDGSNDGTKELIDILVCDYNGFKKIIINDIRENIGLVENFNSAVALCHGEYIAVAAGDDISYPSRISDSVKAFQQFDGISMLSFMDDRIDESGKLTFTSKKNKNHRYGIDDLIKGKYVSNNAASRIFKRCVYTSFGALSCDCKTEDTTYLVRSLLCGDVLELCIPGIKYRIHGKSLSYSHSFCKFDYSKIIKQYSSDINKAYCDNLIENCCYNKLIDWLSCYGEYRRYQQMILFGNSAFCFVQIVFSKISFAYKYRLFRVLARKIVFGLV